MNDILMLYTLCTALQYRSNLYLDIHALYHVYETNRLIVLVFLHKGRSIRFAKDLLAREIWGSLRNNSTGRLRASQVGHDDAPCYAYKTNRLIVLVLLR